MYTTYHLASADEVPNIVGSIMSAYKSKAITITIEEDEDELSEKMKTILDKRLTEDESNYLTADQSITQMKAKYGV
jgi:riboflavin synthase